MRIKELSVAWDWVLRLRDDAVTQEDLAAWLHWYEADESHKAAFEEMQAFWRGADQILDGRHAPTMAQLLGTPPSFRRKPESSQNKFFTLIPIFAGTAAVLLAAIALWIWRPYSSPPPTPIVRQELLPDGSRVELAAKSSVKVAYTPRERTLELSAGEAYFSVAQNRDRPFIVKVGTLQVRAIGTAFNIRKAEQRVVVAVTEGVVEVSPGTQNPVQITAGHKAVWDAGATTPAITSTDIAHALAWRQGRLEYLNEPLSAVIADVNRYSPRHIVIRDEAVGHIAYSGTVFTNATDVWLQALPQVFSVEMSTDRSGNWVLAKPAR